MSAHPGFDFPRLGDTGAGELLHRGKHGDVYWQDRACPDYYVTLQADRPACAFRCHYPNGSSPCDQATADAYIVWASAGASCG